MLKYLVLALLLLPQVNTGSYRKVFSSGGTVAPVGTPLCSTSGSSVVTSLVLNFTPSVAGHQIAVEFVGIGSGSVYTLTDNGGSSYITPFTQATTGGSVITGLSGTLSVGSGTTQITLSESGGGTQEMSLCAQELSGALSTGYTAYGTNATGTLYTGSLTAHSETGNYIVSAIATAPVTYTATTGTILVQIPSTGGGRSLAVMGGSAASGATVTQAGNIGGTSHAISQVLMEWRAHP